MTGPPPPRPALRRAADAEVHPALVVHRALEVTPTGSAEPVKQRDTATVRRIKAAGAKHRPKNKAPRDRGTKDMGSKDKVAAGKPGVRAVGGGLLGPGRTTSDSLRPKRTPGKLARMDVKVPKSLRRQLRRRAAESGRTVESLVTEILTAAMADGRWW